MLPSFQAPRSLNMQRSQALVAGFGCCKRGPRFHLRIPPRPVCRSLRELFGASMRRSIYALSLALSTFALVACEDGPDQTFTPSPAGAANYLNNGNTDASVGSATAGFVVDSGGGTKVQQ